MQRLSSCLPRRKLGSTIWTHFHCESLAQAPCCMWGLVPHVNLDIFQTFRYVYVYHIGMVQDNIQRCSASFNIYRRMSGAGVLRLAGILLVLSSLIPEVGKCCNLKLLWRRLATKHLVASTLSRFHSFHPSSGEKRSQKPPSDMCHLPSSSYCPLTASKKRF